MAEIDLSAVMDEIAGRVLLAVDGLERAYGWPNPAITPPAFIVGYPETIALDATMERGSDRAVFPCWMVCGKADLRTSRDVLASFLLGIKGALDGESTGDPAPWQTARASSITMEAALDLNGVEYLAARFDVDILT